MRVRSVVAAVLVLALLALPLGGCSAFEAFTPPDWSYFDVVQHPVGGVPATGGYYLGVAAWSPVGFLLGALLPEPLDSTIGWGPGEAMGTGLGLVLGAPFHLCAFPFGD